MNNDISNIQTNKTINLIGGKINNKTIELNLGNIYNKTTDMIGGKIHNYWCKTMVFSQGNHL